MLTCVESCAIFKIGNALQERVLRTNHNMAQREQKVYYIDDSGRKIRDLTHEEFNVYMFWKMASNNLTLDFWETFGWKTIIQSNDYIIIYEGYGPVVYKPNSNFSIGNGAVLHGHNGRGYEGKLIIKFFTGADRNTVQGVYRIVVPRGSGNGAARGEHGDGHSDGHGRNGGGRGGNGAARGGGRGDGGGGNGAARGGHGGGRGDGRRGRKDL